MTDKPTNKRAKQKHDLFGGITKRSCHIMQSHNKQTYCDNKCVHLAQHICSKFIMTQL